ncbi:MAG: glycosyltransferase family 2 protein [Acidimicrobiia bacterium]|nr:glycosyltransferase family 2 protein [Acidimicrobiia bacterium]
MDPHPQAPSVVAVVVASDPGEWLEETLAALGDQDYPNLSVLVLDAGNGTADLAERIAPVLPDAYVRRIEGAPGYGRAANEALAAVEGAAFFLFCHDDVAPDGDAVRLLVEEALRSNAGIVGPKLVQWQRPERLADVGLTVNKLGAGHSLIERGEMDQEQHDAVRDVYAVPGACMLVRSDLFEALGGFDAAMADHGGDVDLGWRAQVAGARVLVAPAARVRHLDVEELRSVTREDTPVLEARDRVRAMLKNYSLFHLLRVVPQALLATLADLVTGIFSGSRGRARAPVEAWAWNVRHLGELRPLRDIVQRARLVPDSDVRRLQVGGTARRAAAGDVELGEREGAITRGGRTVADAFTGASARQALVVWAAIALALFAGSRHLFGGTFPSVGQLASFPHRATLTLHNFVSGVRVTGLGTEAPAPAAPGLLGLAGLALVGSMGLLQRVLVLGAIPVGVIGAWRFTKPFESTQARLVGTVVYVSIPVAADALARGRWPALVAYAVAPWLLRALAKATGLEPWDVPGGPPRRLPIILRLGLLLAVAGAFVPSMALVALAVALGLVLGSLLVGTAGAALRSLGTAVAAVGVAFALLVPWSLQFVLPGREWAAFAGASPSPVHAPGFGALLRFQIGPVGAPPLGWAFVVAAALPLLMGRGWRLAWAVRLWSVALVCVAIAWASGRGWFLPGVQVRDAMLGPAALALAGAASLGMVAFQTDLARYRFGLRQLASVVAAAAVAAGALAILPAVASGRWYTPSNDIAQAAAWMRAEVPSGSFRTLWIGDPDVLPGTGWPIQDGLAYALSRNGPPDADQLWPGSSTGATQRVAAALAVVRQGRTTRLGHLLAPMAIRYIAVPTRLAPGQANSPAFPVPADLSAGLVAQLDLRELPSDPALLVYENTAWGPLRAATPPVPDSRLGVDLSGAHAVLPSPRTQTRYAGTVPAANDVLVSEASSRWSLDVAGRGTPRQRSFGWADRYAVDAGGHATLRYRTPALRYLAVLAELVLWVIVIWAALRLRRRSEATA